MGFFDSLFGSGKKEEPPKKKKKRKQAPAVEEQSAELPAELPPAVTVEGEIDPKVVAAIMASIDCMTEMTDDAELIAAITAAIVHSRSTGGLAVRIKRTNSTWAVAGRQKIMDSRQMA